MRDFKAGRDINVAGDVQIFDDSTQPKLFIVCSNEELLAERTHRKELLNQERRAKWKRLATGWVVVAVVLGAAALWFYAQGKANLSGLVLGFGGMAAGFASVNMLEQPSDFEARQIAALAEIRMILRERGVER